MPAHARLADLDAGGEPEVVLSHREIPRGVVGRKAYRGPLLTLPDRHGYR